MTINVEWGVAAHRGAVRSSDQDSALARPPEVIDGVSDVVASVND